MKLWREMMCKMGKFNLDDLNDVHFDVLRELGNIGAGNAATSISSMISMPVSISVPIIHITDYNKATSMLGGPENVLVGILLMVSGDINGMIMFLLEKDFAHLILNTLLGNKFSSFEDVDEMGMSALKEIGNIMAAAYVNAISSLTGMVIDISTPEICIDMVGSILSVPVIHFSEVSDKLVLIQDKFSNGMDVAENGNSHVLLLPEETSLKNMMSRLGIEM